MNLSVTDDLRILAATVNGDLALDGDSVISVNVNLAATPAKAAPRIINRVLLSVRIGKPWLYAWSLNETHAPVNLLDGRTSITFMVHFAASNAQSGSKSGSFSAISRNLGAIRVALPLQVSALPELDRSRAKMGQPATGACFSPSAIKGLICHRSSGGRPHVRPSTISSKPAKAEAAVIHIHINKRAVL